MAAKTRDATQPCHLPVDSLALYKGTFISFVFLHSTRALFSLFCFSLIIFLFDALIAEGITSRQEIHSLIFSLSFLAQYV